ncbi:MAG: hypothetical protein SOW59_08495 [Corynebacterium sp.]|nr:hypothetical protein [Corynebacterium sp.]
MVDDVCAVDAVVERVDELDTPTAVHIVYRPGVARAPGRYGACVVVYADSVEAVNACAGYIIDTSTPQVRLRLRRQLGRHTTMAALGCAAGVAPWDIPFTQKGRA